MLILGNVLGNLGILGNVCNIFMLFMCAKEIYRANAI